MDKILADIQVEFQNLLAHLYNQREIRQLLFMLLEQFGISRVHAIAYPDTKISQTDYERLQHQLKRLTNGEPIQYVIGSEQFMGLTFVVTPDVLIPRPETSELVQLVVNRCENDSPTILDVGTGSGCIAISLKKMIENAHVTAIDISESAINVAQLNANNNGTDVSFICKSIFDDDFLVKPASLDVVVSNPPYVTDSEKANMSENVLKYEPCIALFVKDDDPFVFYRRIAELARIWLRKGGKLFFEINERFGLEMIRMLENMGFEDVCLHDDFYGKHRMISALWNGK